MTGDRTDRARRPVRAVPPIFDWLVVLLVVQAHAFNLFMVLSVWPAFTRPWVNLALLGISAAVPIGCAVVARRLGGILPGPLFVVAGAVLLGVDAAQVAVTRPEDRAGPALWCWGAIGVTWLAFAAFRPARESVAYAAAHAAVALVALGPSVGTGGFDAFRLLADLAACLTPSIVAAQYVRLHVRSTQLRERAAAERLQVQAREQALAAVERDVAARVRGLQHAALPLLTDVATGVASPRDPRVAARAAALAEQLRRELVEDRAGQWLLDPSAEWPADRSGDRSGDRDPWPGVTVFDPRHLLSRVTGDQLSALAAVVAILRRHGGWHRVSLALTAGTEGPDAAVQVTIVALGRPTAIASALPEVRAACRAIGGEPTAQSPDVLLVEATLAGGVTVPRSDVYRP